ncbi:MAG: tRNA nucleotidyltransferase [Desulfovibrionales bacterium]
MKILLVGGAVRDLLLGRPVRDFDFLVIGASEEEFMEQFPEARQVGRDFPVFLHQGHEFSFPRAEGVDGDLAARDLTINALALDEQGELYAHPQAIEDLHDRVLRPCSPDSFRRDPLRVFRSARMWAWLPGFRPHIELLESMREAGFRPGVLESLPRERVAGECLKAFEGIRPSRFIMLLHKGTCLSPWFQEIEGADRIPAGPAPFHNETLLGHICDTMDQLAGDPLKVWMGFCHDLGKKNTDSDILPHHYGHEKRGEILAKDLGERLGLPVKYIRAGAIAAGKHMTGGQYPSLRPGTRVDLLMLLHSKDLLEPFFRVVRADDGEDYLPQAKEDLKTILSVHLPEKDRNLGAASGEKLRDLRAQALAEKNP